MTAAVLGLGLAACGGDTHEAVLEDRFQLMDRILDSMEGITDEASAKEAAKTIEALGAKLRDVQKRMRDLGDPTPEQRRRLKGLFQEREAELEKRAQELGRKMMQYPDVVQAFAKAMRPLEK